MVFPYTFPFFFHTPLIYLRDYRIEVRDATGALLRIITKVSDARMTENFNAPFILELSIPFFDPSVPYIEGQNELWVVDQEGNNVGKFIITDRADGSGQDGLWVSVLALSYMHQLSDERIKKYESEEDATANEIIQALIDKQENINPIIYSALPASVGSLARHLKISSSVTILQVFRNLLNTFLPNIRMEIDDSRNLVWTDLDVNPGTEKHFTSTKNLHAVEKVHHFERVITRLYLQGSRQSGFPVRLGDVGGVQRYNYYTLSSSGQTVTFQNIFGVSDNPTGVIKVGESIIINGAEHEIVSFTTDGTVHVVTVLDEFTLETPTILTVRRDFVEAESRNILSRKKLYIDHIDLTAREGYSDYILTVDGTFKDLIAASSGAVVYFVADDLVTVLDATITTYTYTTGVLVSNVKIPFLSGVVPTTIFLVLSTNAVSHDTAVTPTSPQVDFTLFPAIAVMGHREATIDDERIETVGMLQNIADVKIDKLQTPSHSYKVQAVDLSKIRSASHEVFNMGEMVRIIDLDLGINDVSKIVRAEWPIGEPAQLELQFDRMESRTIDAMFADVAKSHFEPNPPLILGAESLGDTDDTEPVTQHTHDNKDTLDAIPPFSEVTSATLPGSADSASWNNEDDALDDDDNLASATTTVEDEWLILTNFSKNVPENNIILGVEITMTIKESASSDIEMSLVVFEVVDGLTDEATPSNIFSEVEFGGPTSLFGLELTPEIVNDSEFGVAIRKAVGTGGSTLSVDNVKIKIYHEKPEGGFLTQTDTGELEWSKAERTRVALVVSGPGVTGTQLYRLQLYSPETKLPESIFVNNCQVPDDNANSFEADDIVMVILPPTATAASNYFPLITSSTPIDTDENWQAVWNEGPS